MSKWHKAIEGAPVNRSEGKPSRRSKSEAPSGRQFLASCWFTVHLLAALMPLLFDWSQLFYRVRDLTVVQSYVNHLCTDTPSENDFCVSPEVLRRWKNGDAYRLDRLESRSYWYTPFLTAVHRQLCIHWSLLWLSSLFSIALLNQWIW